VAERKHIRFVKPKFIPSIFNIQFFNIQLCLNGVFVQALIQKG